MHGTLLGSFQRGVGHSKVFDSIVVLYFEERTYYITLNPL